MFVRCYYADAKWSSDMEEWNRNRHDNGETVSGAMPKKRERHEVGGGHPECTSAQDCVGSPRSDLVRHVPEKRRGDVYCEVCWNSFKQQNLDLDADPVAKRHALLAPQVVEPKPPTERSSASSGADREVGSARPGAHVNTGRLVCLKTHLAIPAELSAKWRCRMECKIPEYDPNAVVGTKRFKPTGRPPKGATLADAPAFVSTNGESTLSKVVEPQRKSRKLAANTEWQRTVELLVVETKAEI